jgi:hypothetical protein
MSNRSFPVRVIAVALVIALQALFTPGPAVAADAASTDTGHVLTMDDPVPLIGAVVHDRNLFEVQDLPEATESTSGFNPFDAPLAVAPADEQNGDLALKPVPVAPGQTESPILKGKARGWNNPLIAALMVVGAVIVLGIAIDAADSDDPANVVPPTPYNN